MAWIPQAIFTKEFDRVSDLTNLLALDTNNEFKIKKRCKIRKVEILPVTVGSFNYSIYLAGYAHGIMGQGICSKVNARFVEIATNNIIKELIWDGIEELVIQPVIHNRTGTLAHFKFIVYYSIWNFKEEEIENEG